MATANGVSSSNHVTELMDQVIEALLVTDISSEASALGLTCLLRALVLLSSVSGSASQTAIDTLLCLLPHSSRESTSSCSSFSLSAQSDNCDCCVAHWLP